MFVIPVMIDESTLDLFVVLEDDNIDRIKQYDPAEVVKKNMLPDHQRRDIRNVIVCYANEEDKARIEKMYRSGADGREVLRFLARGFQFRPEEGDQDGPYEPVKRPVN